jgi:beta-glucosidase-like glycosyl hydrolase/CubicO group peptidase (beta-lactamase class C family)
MMKKLFKILLIIALFSVKVSYSENPKIPEFLNVNNSWVDSLMITLSEDEKIAQLFMISVLSNQDEKYNKNIADIINRYKIGGLMFLQGGPIRQAKLTNYFQSISKVPLMIALDAEFGLAMRLDSTFRFPWQMTLGATSDTNLIFQMGAEIARQCKLIGVNINFAPVVDVNSNPKNPIINNRSFGEDPFKVAQLSLAYMRGLQENNVLACAKHFPGHGDTDQDSHKTLPLVNHNRETLDKIDIYPFKKLIDNGLGSIMTAHLYIPSLEENKLLPVSLSKKVVTDLLVKELNFKGLKFTDGLNMKAVSDLYSSGELDVKALIAGNDVLLCAEDVPLAIEKIKEALNNGLISNKEIEEKCRKILLAKKWMKLDSYTPLLIEEIKNNICQENTLVINNKLVKSSLTLLQNYDNIIPLKNLDTLKIASVAIGESGHIFQKSLNLYQRVDTFSIAEDAGVKDQAYLLNQLAKYNLVIVSVHKSNKNFWNSYKISKSTDIFIQTIAMQSKVLLTVFANPYSLNSFLFTDNFDGLLLAYQNSDLAQDFAAQSIFGGISIDGKTPVQTNHFKINSGLNTLAFRMSYVNSYDINIDSKLDYSIDSIIKNAIDNKAFPGCQVFIAKGDQVFLNKSYGFHTYDKKIKVSKSDVYDLASITKIASTIPSLMKLVDENRFSLQANLGYYLNIQNSNKHQLLIKDILAHQAGLQSWIPFYKKTLYKDSILNTFSLRDNLYSKFRSLEFPIEVADSVFLHFSYPDSIFNQIIESDLLLENEYVYSDLGYYLLKPVIENISKLSLEDYTNFNFYKKLGMENLGYLPRKRLSLSRIIPTENDFIFRGQLIKGYVHDMGAAMFGGVGAHAGLFSNANDLAKLMRMFLNNGVYADQRFLSKNVIQRFTDCQFCELDNRRGAGFDKPALEHQEGGPTCKCVSKLSFGHSGFTGTLAWADPETQIIYIFLSNRIYPDASNKKLLEMNVRTDIMDLIFKYNKLSVDSIPVSKNQLDKLFLNKNIESVDTAIEINLNDLQPIYEE